jgi:2,4-dienoyl-CoA reductase-like NADH-dependent reductase (Old Yellow Enzyme family)
MSRLFETTNIKGMTLANRFVRSATWEGMAAEDGSSTPRLTELMVKLARGGVGLIITGHTYVSPEGQADPWQLGIHRDDLVPDLTEMGEAVHQAGGKIVLQLAHAGDCHLAVKLAAAKAKRSSTLEGKKVPSCTEISRQEIQRIVGAFAQGARRSQRAGLDGVQVHAAHGYLLSQFLSPFYNKRKDEYGGSVEDRARFVLEVVGSVKTAVGEDYPVLIKMNSEDFLAGGLSLEDMLKVAAMLERAGIDVIELSGGTIDSGRYFAVREGKLESEEKEVYYREAARRYKEEIGVPLMLVGGIRSYAVAEDLVDQGLTDYISMCRPLIREPHLINRWMGGDTRRATCLSDNLCFQPATKGEGLHCVVEERLRQRKEETDG